MSNIVQDWLAIGGRLCRVYEEKSGRVITIAYRVIPARKSHHVSFINFAASIWTPDAKPKVIKTRSSDKTSRAVLSEARRVEWASLADDERDTYIANAKAKRADHLARTEQLRADRFFTKTARRMNNEQAVLRAITAPHVVENPITSGLAEVVAGSSIELIRKTYLRQKLFKLGVAAALPTPAEG